MSECVIKWKVFVREPMNIIFFICMQVRLCVDTNIQIYFLNQQFYLLLPTLCSLASSQIFSQLNAIEIRNDFEMKLTIFYDAVGFGFFCRKKSFGCSKIFPIRNECFFPSFYTTTRKKLKPFEYNKSIQMT